MIKKVFKGIFLIVIIVLSAAALKFYFIGKDLKIDEVAIYLTKSTNIKGINLTYLGCAGFIIEHNNKSILCDPYISNPSISNFGNEHEEWAKYVLEDKLRTIDLVTISHGHYDHCYDIESLCNYIQPNSKIIADSSVQYQLNALYKDRNLQKTSLDFNANQDWIYNSDHTFRVLALDCTHNPHIGNLEFLNGSYHSSLSKIPANFWEWKKGNVYSYLIDVLEHDSIVYRIVLVNGEFTNTAIEKLKAMSKQRSSDLQLQIYWKDALVVKNMFDVYNIAHPNQIILHHWNNFFRSNDKTLQYFRSSKLPEVLKKYNDSDLPVSFMLPFREADL